MCTALRLTAAETYNLSHTGRVALLTVEAYFSQPIKISCYVSTQMYEANNTPSSIVFNSIARNLMSFVTDRYRTVTTLLESQLPRFECCH